MVLNPLTNLLTHLLTNLQDTFELTETLLKANSYFGMLASQVTWLGLGSGLGLGFGL